ncbi:MAG: spore coat associated protein CotJA [Syntrophomonadales bacterium]
MRGPSEPELARAFIKIQEYTKRYSPMEGLQKGTIFPELYMPYEKHERRERGPQVKREREQDPWRFRGRGGRNG